MDLNNEASPEQQEMSQSDRDQYINRARGLREYSSRVSQETMKLDAMQDMIKFLADKIVAIEERIGSAESQSQAQQQQNPLNAPVEITGAQQQQNPLEALANMAGASKQNNSN